MMEKKKFKVFTVDNFEKEEEYLREMSQQGWHFKNYKGLKYTFKKDEPKDFYYQIDYHSSEEGNRNDYLQFFEDSGWTHVSSYPILDGEWVYFRKDTGQSGAPEIFTDSTSKIDLFRKLRKKWSTFGITSIILVIIAAVIAGIATDMMFPLLLLLLLIIFVSVLYGKLILNLTRKIRELQQ